MKSFLKKIIHKFSYAFQGLIHGLMHDRSIQIQAVIGFVVICIGFYFHFCIQEWVIVISMILLVVASEFANSVIEEICDTLYPDYDERAKKIKDYAAAFVLLVSFIAAIVGIYILKGYIV